MSTPATIAVTRQARTWASANLPAYPTDELHRALAGLSAHPDLARPGYSVARSAHRRLLAELTGRAGATPL